MAEPGRAGIVLVASGRDPYALLLPPDVDLGRQIVAGGTTHDLGDDRMSREHAKVRFESGTWTVTDLDSRNGTYLNGERVLGTRQARGVAILRIGHSLFGLLPDATGHPVGIGQPHGPELGHAFDELRTHALRERDVLLDAEDGNAKLRAARAYHAASARKAGPFIAVNCGALPDGVGERLLFGARNAAFANSTRSIGHVQMADGGTLFLDEVADLDDSSQQRLLRLLADREVVPVGATSGSPLDMAIVASSRHELQVAVDQRRFRAELLAALARYTVRLPPLRARPLDIVRIVQRECAHAHKAAHAKLVEACCLRTWPGNDRELESALHHAIETATTAERDLVRLEDLAATAGLSLDANAAATAVERPKQPSKALARAEVVEALARANGVVAVAARQLGMHRTELYRLMEAHGLKSDARED